MRRPTAATPSGVRVLGSPRLFDVLAPLGQPRRHAAGSIVVQEGDPGASLFLVHSGELRATLAGGAGRIVELNVLLAGEIFGELSLALPARMATVEVTATAQLTEVSRALARDALLRHPELAMELVDGLIARVGFLTQRVRGLVAMDVYGRMVDLFAAMVQIEDGLAVLQRMTQQAIAERIGASRGMVNKLLKDLVRGGYLRLEPDRMVLQRPLPRHW